MNHLTRTKQGQKVSLRTQKPEQQTGASQCLGFCCMKGGTWAEVLRLATFLSPAAHHGQSCTEPPRQPPHLHPRSSCPLQSLHHPHNTHLSVGSAEFSWEPRTQVPSSPCARKVQGWAQTSQVVVTGQLLDSLLPTIVPFN